MSNEPLYKIDRFLHRKNDTSDKIYGGLFAKDHFFYFYGKNNIDKNRRHINLNHFGLVNSSHSIRIALFFAGKMANGYEEIYNSKKHSGDALDYIDKIYYRFHENIERQVIKGVLRYT